jgi:radical SAM protein with 4Fe4S-binding SPASM domain
LRKKLAKVLGGVGTLFQKGSDPPEANYNHLSWVDTFIDNVRPYIFVRLEDNLLIKRPNNATKLNPMGAHILYSLLGGTPIRQLLAKAQWDPDKINSINHFLWAVKQYLEGSLDEFSCNPAVDSIPFEMNFSQFPVLSEIALTYRCNLKCRFCYAGCNNMKKTGHETNEMSVAQVKEILWKLFHQAKVPSVSFTGGEPVLVSRLPKYIRFAKRLGMRVNLITNGTLITREVAQILADSGLDSAQVSLEGVTPGTHDAIVQCPGAFQKTLAAVEWLKETGIRTHTNTTITGENLAECKAMPGFVKNFLNNERFSMNLVIPTGSGAVYPDIPVKYSEVSPLLQDIIKHSNEQGVEFMWYSPVPMCMFNSILHNLGNKGCSACDGLISIAPNGDVLPCASCADPVGNFLEKDFNTIWQSIGAARYREKSLAHPGCKMCAHFHICNGACPLYWQHMGFAELIPFIQNSPGVPTGAVAVENIFNAASAAQIC